jgi:hypothetical protein
MCKERGATVIVSCPAALRRILANCPFIDTVLEKVSDPDFDLDVPITSLPHVFKTDLGTIPAAIPYLNVSKATRAKWAQKFSDKRGFKVGLVWAGDPRNDQKNANRVDRRRSMDLELLRPLFDVRDVRFYNLQMGAQADQIDRCGLRERITDFMGDVRDFEDTAAIVEHLDLVISVDTSVVHLAGGMGKPVFVMSRFDACWRWLQNRPDSPWYPTARVFGQQEPGNWTGVVERVKAALVETARDAPPPIR